MSGGLYIVLEGHSCVGKTTQMGFLEQWFRSKGLSVARTREPGGPEAAEEIRSAIFDLKGRGLLSQRDELWLFYAGRGYSMEWLEEQYKAGVCIGLKDRDFMSTHLYQATTGVDEEEIAACHQKLYVEKGFREPDLRIMLLLGEEELERRLRIRGAQGDAFDKEWSFALAVRDRYAKLARELAAGRGGMFQENTVVVNGEGSKEVILERICGVIEERLDLEGVRRRIEGGSRRVEVE